MNMWEILGIPPTTDIVLIKKAFGERAKIWHPEEHPEEFKRLRNAYQAALKWAKTEGKCSQEEREGADGKRSEEERAGTGGRQWSEEKRSQERRSEEYAADDEEPQPHFSYDNVTSFYQRDLEERFFREFYRIVWNPYLQNKRAVWSYFLFRPDYDDMVCNESFRRRLLEEICIVPGWHGDTLEYFEDWEKLRRETDRDRREESGFRLTDSRRWRRKKWRSRFTGTMPEQVASPEQRQEHYAILRMIKDRGLEDSLLDMSSAAAYLQYYGAFLEDNEQWLESQRSFSQRKRRKRWLLTGTMAFFLMLLVSALVIVPQISASKEEKLREEKKREEAVFQEEQENREQEEWQRELEERFHTMQEQYRDWIEQSDKEEAEWQ